MPVAAAIQHGVPFKVTASCFPAKYYCMCTMRSSLRQEGHLYEVFHILGDMSYLRTSVKGCSKIRRVLAKLHLLLDKIFHLYRKFVSYLRPISHNM